MASGKSLELRAIRPPAPVFVQFDHNQWLTHQSAPAGDMPAVHARTSYPTERWKYRADQRRIRAQREAERKRLQDATSVQLDDDELLAALSRQDGSAGRLAAQEDQRIHQARAELIEFTRGDRPANPIGRPGLADRRRRGSTRRGRPSTVIVTPLPNNWLQWPDTNVWVAE